MSSDDLTVAINLAIKVQPPWPVVYGTWDRNDTIKELELRYRVDTKWSSPLNDDQLKYLSGLTRYMDATNTIPFRYYELFDSWGRKTFLINYINKESDRAIGK